MVDLELFRINVKSFIENGSVTNCNLPDEDGVVRHHCIAITEPLQGSGNSIQGAEFDYRQGFTFLPSFLANTGMEFNFTYAPSNTGERDLAGNKIPFQDNSTESGNFILWYQDKHFQARVAYNYRSKRAFQNSVGGIAGLEEYEAPQQYVDASLAYKFNKYLEVFVDGTNLTNEYQRFYLVWPDQFGHSNFSERMFTLRRPRTVVMRIRVMRARPGAMVGAARSLAGASLACAESAFSPTQVDGGAGSATAIAHWQIQSSAKAQQGGAEVSSAGFSTDGWYPVSGRATVMAGLMENGKYQNVFYGDNLRAVEEPDASGTMFVIPWWYRTEFTVGEGAPGTRTLLRINGMIPSADVWLNGQLVAEQADRRRRLSRA